MQLINYWRLDIISETSIGLRVPPMVSRQTIVIGPPYILTPVSFDLNQRQVFGVWDLGDGTVAFSADPGVSTSCTNGGPFWSSRQYFGSPHGIVTLAEYETTNWECAIGDEERFNLIPTGDGRVAIYSLSQGRADSGSGGDDPGACHGYLNITNDAPPFVPHPTARIAGGFGDDVRQACAFTVVPTLRPAFLDILDVNRSGTGLRITEDLSNMSFAGRTLVNLDLREAASIAGCDFSGADLSGANLTGRTDLAKAKFAGAKLVKAELAGCDLRGVDLRDVDLTNADLSKANLAQNTNLAGAKFVGADLCGCTLDGADFHGTDLTGARLGGSSVTRCRLGGADLAGTDLSGLDLTEVDLSGLKHPTDPKQPTNLQRSTVPFSSLGLDWSCLDLSGSTINDLPLNLTDLNATGAHLTRIVFDRHVLDGAVFDGANLDGASFAAARMHTATFSSAILTNAAFSGAMLDNCSFVGAVMGGTTGDAAPILSGAYIANCDLTGCDLYGVSFANATLIGANVFGGAANLQEANFSGAYLAGADLSGANLCGARLDRAFMVQSILRNANFAPARDGSVRASLTFACLQGAITDGANFRGADLSDAAVTADPGSILQRYLDENGQLTEPTPIDYAATPLPALASLSAETVCPNGLPLATNQRNGLTLAQMMSSPHAPTSWKPESAPDESPPSR